MLVKIFLALLVIVLLSYLWLRIRNARLAGDDLSIYDSSPQPFAVAEPSAPFAVAEPSAGLERINAYIREMFVVPAEAGKAGGGWTSKRERFDEAGLKRGKDFEDIEFRPDVITVDGRDIPGSWTLAPGYDAARRLLYMHGGAFTVGSDMFQQILKAPKLMLLPSLQHYYGMSPSDPDQSPINIRDISAP